MTQTEIISAEMKDMGRVYELICELENTQINKECFIEAYTHNINSPAVFFLFSCEGYYSNRIFQYAYPTFAAPCR